MFNQTHAPVLLLLRIPSCGSAFRGSARAPLPASEGQNTQTAWGTRTRHRNGQGTGCSAGVNIAGRKAIGGVERPSLSIQYRRLLPESVSPLAPAAQSLPHSPYGKRLVPGHCLSKQPVCRRGGEPGPPPPANEEQQNCSIAPCGVLHLPCWAFGSTWPQIHWLRLKLPCTRGWRSPAGYTGLWGMNVGRLPASSHLRAARPFRLCGLARLCTHGGCGEKDELAPQRVKAKFQVALGQPGSQSQPQAQRAQRGSWGISHWGADRNGAV